MSSELISTLQVLPAESCIYLQRLLIRVITIPRDPTQGQGQRSDLPSVISGGRREWKIIFISYSKPFSSIGVLLTLSKGTYNLYLVL